MTTSLFPNEFDVAAGVVLVGDCLNRLRDLPDASVHSVVTDPPYEIGFMGKGWDSTGIAYSVELWRECLRVLKPGGHLLAFGATRSYHRMAVAIEEAGFEIRDSIHWTYGSGFPKSLNVGKAIDKAAGAERPVVGKASHSQPAKSGHHAGMTASGVKGDGERFTPDLTAPATDAAKRWDGWGTALKPSHEPIVLARKPLAGTVASNVLEHGAGALNIDACRVGTTDDMKVTKYPAGRAMAPGGGKRNTPEVEIVPNAAGRWPANTVLTHAADCVQTGTAADARQGGARTANFGTQETVSGGNGSGSWGKQESTVPVWACAAGCPAAGLDQQADGASRFFTQATWDADLDDYDHLLYVAKPSKRERNAGLDGLPEKRPDNRTTTGMGTFDEKGVAKQSNHHPTVKPVTLMRHLIAMTTPPGGTVLDPFLGSGTTAVAAELEGVNWIGCEMTPDYLPIIVARALHAADQPPAGPTQASLPLDAA